MPDAGPVEIEVACAWPEKQVVRLLQVPAGTTARQAVHRSGLADEFADLDIAARSEEHTSELSHTDISRMPSSA